MLLSVFSLPIRFYALDLLGDDYTGKISLKCKKSAGPISVTIETERGGGGALSSKIGGKFAYSGLSFDKVQLKADGGHVIETSLKPYPGVKVREIDWVDCTAPLSCLIICR